MSYTPTDWKDGDVITAERMNKLERGVQNEQTGPPGPAGPRGLQGPAGPQGEQGPGQAGLPVSEDPLAPRESRVPPAPLDRREIRATRAIPGPLDQPGGLRI